MGMGLRGQTWVRGAAGTAFGTGFGTAFGTLEQPLEWPLEQPVEQPLEKPLEWALEWPLEQPLELWNGLWNDLWSSQVCLKPCALVFNFPDLQEHRTLHPSPCCLCTGMSFPCSTAAPQVFEECSLPSALRLCLPGACRAQPGAAPAGSITWLCCSWQLPCQPGTQEQAGWVGDPSLSPQPLGSPAPPVPPG